MNLVNNLFKNSLFFAVDGCQTGWICSTVMHFDIYINYYSNLEALKNTTLYIDIPVKLPKRINAYPRKEDLNAKKLLGSFHSSVFYAPIKSWLHLNYHQINEQCEFYNKPKISIQSFNLFKKIIEIQHLLNNDVTIKEIHPELLFHSFLRNNKISKKKSSGLYQRILLINTLFNTRFNFKQLLDQYHYIRDNHQTAALKLDDIVDSLFSGLLVNYFYHNNKNNDIIENSDCRKRFDLY
tara:strand:+ start:165 stop:878 length:714 start_codon:yes stop_codon:yes gene_type:complete